MKILVTGGGGFVGLALVRRLVKLGFEVSTFSRKIYPEHQKLGVKIFQGNLVNSVEIERACKGMDTVFHIAAKVGMWGLYSDFYKNNVIGTENVIKACKNNRVNNLIFTSSASVVFDGSNLEGVEESVEYPKNPVSNYTATKAIAEQLVINANSNSFKTISLRPHLVWGLGDTQLVPGILKRAKTGRLRKIGRKDFLTDNTYIDNLIEAQFLALKMLNNKSEVCGKPFFITNDEPVLVWDFINSILQSAGIPPVHKTIPKFLALFVAGLFEKTHRIFHLKTEPYITRFAIHELCTHHWFNISAAKKLLGYSPQINFKTGMERLTDSFSKNRDS